MDKTKNQNNKILADESLHAVLEASTESMIIIDPSGIIHQANEVAASRFGAAREEDLIGRRLFDFVPDELKEFKRARITEAIENGKPSRFEEEEGGRVYDHSLFPIRDENGRVGRLAVYIRDVSDLRRADEELRRERQRQIYYMELLPGFLALITRDHSIRYANRYFRKYFNVSRGSKCPRQINSEKEPNPCVAWFKAFDTEKPVQYEWTNTDGRTFQTYSHPMTDTDGEVLILVLGIDISERKKAEEAVRKARDELEIRVEQRTAELKESESRYRGVIEDQTELICRFSSERLVYFANGAYCRFFGKSEAELMGGRFMDQVHPEDIRIVEDSIGAVSRRESVVTREIRVMVKQGETRWIRWAIRSIFDENQLLVDYQAVGRDITESKHVEQQYFELIQNLPVVVFALRSDLQLDFINSTCEKALGYTVEEAMGEPDWFLRRVHPEDREEVRRTMRDCFTACRHDFSMDFRFVHKKGYLVHLQAKSIVLTRPIEAGCPTRLEGIITDVTERTYLDRVLVQREKLNTLGAMSAELAHEIRNPLMPLAGFARRLKQKHPDLIEAEMILEESIRLERLLDRISKYLEPVSVKRGECRVNAILRFCFDLLQVKLGKLGVAWTLELDEGAAPVMSDEEILTQVFINLINNAAESMEPGGSLTAATSETELQVNIDFRFGPVSGPIVNPDLLFLPFEPEEKNFNLAVSYRLIKNVGGFLSFKQNEKGRVFIISLPKTDFERA